MGKKDEDNLRRDLALYRAMVLDRYIEPTPIDLKAALDASTETTRFGGKVIHGYVYVAGKTEFGWFKATRNQFGIDEPAIYEHPTLALIAERNRRARVAAALLMGLDDEISKLVTGSGILPGVVAMKSDISGSTASCPSTAEAVRQIQADEHDPVAIVAAAENPLDDAPSPAPEFRRLADWPDKTLEPALPLSSEDTDWPDAIGVDPASFEGAKAVADRLFGVPLPSDDVAAPAPAPAPAASKPKRKPAAKKTPPAPAAKPTARRRPPTPALDTHGRSNRKVQ